MKITMHLIKLAAAMLILACLAGCPAPGPASIRGVQGIVREVGSSAPVSGATVTVGGLSATTDQAGTFSINAPSLIGDLTLKVANPGYVSYQRIVSCLNERTPVSVVLLPQEPSQTIVPATGGTVATVDGASIVFPPLSGIHETLLVRLTNIDVKTGEAAAVPGDFTAIDSQGRDRFLLSLGIIDVEIIGATSGNSYTLSGLGPFTIRIPVTGTCSALPGSVPLWYFDTASSKWKEEGSAALNGTFYEGTVTHFSMWNIDIPEVLTGCVDINLIDTNPAPNEEYKVLVHIPPFDSYYHYRGAGNPIRINHLPRYGDDVNGGNTEAYIQITKLSSGERWIGFYNDLPAGSCLPVTAIIGDEQYPSIAGITITQAMGPATGTVTISWTTEPNNGLYAGVSIGLWDLYSNDNSDGVDVPKGIKTYTFNGLAEGVYKISFIPIYSNAGFYNNNHERMIGLFAGPTKKLSITTIIFPGTFNGSAGIGVQPPQATAPFQYLEPFDFPLNQQVKLTKPAWWAWFGDVHQTGENSYMVTEDTITMDADKYISTRINAAP
jgi:hypothetical protein